MKSFYYHILFVFLAVLFSACKQKSEICECFETRLEIKQLIKDAENPSALIETERYKDLKARKSNCLTNIEPGYFEEKELHRNGRNDKEFLLEELGHCKAVRELLEME